MGFEHPNRKFPLISSPLRPNLVAGSLSEHALYYVAIVEGNVAVSYDPFGFMSLAGNHYDRAHPCPVERRLDRLASVNNDRIR